jgi:ABC-type nickel/cobalt efflux system permease component RcnA
LDRTRDAFGQLLTSNQELSPIVLLVSFLAAMALGAVHAFSPGHGKAVVGAYLVGSRGNWQHAVFLGSVVTLTHTAGVYALGAVTLFLSAYVLPEQLFPLLGFISGLLVAMIGARLFIQRFRAARAQTTTFDRALASVLAQERSHSHSDGRARQVVSSRPHIHADGTVHDHHDEHALVVLASGAAGHDHEHERENGHRHGHAHIHADGTHGHNGERNDPVSHSHDFATPEQEAAHAREHLADIQSLEKPSWTNLLSLGISGGLLPCPSALVVMLSAIALGRILYGFFLIVGFSLGLAGVLVLTGLVLLYAGKYAGKLFGGQRVGVVMRYVPIIGAILVALLGVGIALDAVLQMGLVR